jgi:hypothetical protein
MKKQSNAVLQNEYHKRNNADKKNRMNDASKTVIMHHLSSFRDNDLEAVLSDYSDNSVLITQAATYTGKEEIRDFFAGLMVHFPNQKSNFELDHVVAHEELVYIVWHANTPSVDVSLGSDTFIVKKGKIAQQTFVGNLKFTPQ